MLLLTNESDSSDMLLEELLSGIWGWYWISGASNSVKDWVRNELQLIFRRSNSSHTTVRLFVLGAR